MKLEFIALDKLSVSKANMRYARKAPDVSDILPTVRRRGVIQPVLVRPIGTAGSDAGDVFEVVAGARRFHAAWLVSQERAEQGAEIDPMPCAILDDGDDAAAIEASLIENLARRDPDEVSQWVTFTRLVKEGRKLADISDVFGMPELAVRRVLALGNLLPRIRNLYASDEIDAASIRHLTMATKRQQQDWLALYDDADSYAPTGQRLKSWLLGGQAIPLRHALFETSDVTTISDLFGGDAYFADADAFWQAQDAAIAARREALLAAGWNEVVIVPPEEHFHSWEHEKAPKRKGGRVYIDVRGNGEVAFHEGYVTTAEARRIAKGESVEPEAKPTRAEITSTLGTYVDLHRHAATRAVLLGHPGVALRLMVAHAITGSPLWTVRPEPQACRNDDIAQSVAEAPGEADFDHARLKVLRLLHLSDDEPRVTGGNGDSYGLVGLFLRLLALGDDDVMAVLAVVMGETIEAGSAVLDAVAAEIGVDMAACWQADDAFFDTLRDREVLLAMVAEVAGPLVAEANAKGKGKTLKGIIRAHLAGTDGRAKVEGWVPRWLAFPPSAYTARGGVGSIAAFAKAEAARSEWADVRAAGTAAIIDADDENGETETADPAMTPPLAA